MHALHLNYIKFHIEIHSNSFYIIFKAAHGEISIFESIEPKLILHQKLQARRFTYIYTFIIQTNAFSDTLLCKLILETMIAKHVYC